MKTITIKQPWASLIVHGIKDIENRTWPCPKKYIGQRVLIHAGASCLSWYKVQHYLTRAMSRAFEKHKLNGEWVRHQPTSAIIGSVEIVDCVINHPSIWAEQTEGFLTGIKPKLHEFITGKKVIYNWVLVNPIIYENPIKNIKGKLSFWDYPGINEVKIECPYCGSIELAVEDYTTVPWPTYLHKCRNCGVYIMESEWQRVKEE